MRLTRLMLSASAAIVALAACNKVNTDVPENTSLKTVKISFENVIMTKGLAGDKINGGDPVLVTDFQIIITDASYSTEYKAKSDAAGTTDATYYFTGETLGENGKEYEFHYVDHKANKVIAIANMGKQLTLEEIKSFTNQIADQQDQKKLVLWADASLQPTGETHTAEDSDKYTEVFGATLSLKPAISRFEVDGFVVNFSSTPKFSKVEVTDIAFDHYYPEMKFSTESGTFAAVASGNHIKYVDDYESEADVFGWFNNTAATTGWYIDRFTGEDIPTMTPDDSETTDAYENRADTKNPLAYHFFAGDLVPTMVIKLLADGNPAYVYTSRFKAKSNNQDITKIESGKIYRMSAAGVKDDTGGSVPLPDDFDPIERCLDITVSVEDWVVELITPEFE